MKRARKRAYRPPATFAKQPRISAIIKLLDRRRGITASEAAARLEWNAASIRAVISRLGQVGTAVERTWVRGRGLVYRRQKQ
jgi:hypothetical protein